MGASSLVVMSLIVVCAIIVVLYGQLSKDKTDGKKEERLDIDNEIKVGDRIKFNDMREGMVGSYREDGRVCGVERSLGKDTSYGSGGRIEDGYGRNLMVELEYEKVRGKVKKGSSINEFYYQMALSMYLGKRN